MAGYIAELDALCSLAYVADKNNYVRPSLNTDGVIDIKGGRHPVVEKMLANDSFVENDTYLNNAESRISIITGPNMAGKSTYMRQTALIHADGPDWFPLSLQSRQILDSVTGYLPVSVHRTTSQADNQHL